MMPEYDHITFGEEADLVLGSVGYSVTTSINVICPNCGNPDCAEIEEFKARLKERLWPSGETG